MSRPDQEAAGSISRSMVGNTISNSAVALGNGASASNAIASAMPGAQELKDLRDLLEGWEGPEKDVIADTLLRLDAVEAQLRSKQPDRAQLAGLLRRLTSGLTGMAGLSEAAIRLTAALHGLGIG